MINAPIFYKYDSHRFYGFFYDLLNLLERINDAGLAAHLQPLTDMMAALDAGHRLDKDNLLTKAIKETDEKRDNALVGIRKMAEAQTTHYNPQQVAAAELLLRNFKKYGNVIRLPYSEQSAAVNSMLNDWAVGDLNAALQTLGLTAWRDYLKTTQQQFDNIYLDRVQAEAAQTAVPISKLRPDAMKVYQDFAMLLTVFAKMTPATYLPIVEQVNELIQKYNTPVVATNDKKTENTETNTL